MSEENQTQENQQHGPSEQDISREAEQIVSEGTNVVRRIQSLVLDVIKNKQLGVNELGDVARAVMDGSFSALEAALAEKAEGKDEEQKTRETEQAKETLREVFQGLDAAFSDVAQATAQALDQAKERGERFAKEDLGKTLNDLKGLEELLVKTVKETAAKSNKALGEQLQAIGEHAKIVGTKLRPSVESALEAAREHPVEFSREAAGQVMYKISSLLLSAGDIISGKKPPANEQNEREQNEEEP